MTSSVALTGRPDAQLPGPNIGLQVTPLLALKLALKLAAVPLSFSPHALLCHVQVSSFRYEMQNALSLVPPVLDQERAQIWEFVMHPKCHCATPTALSPGGNWWRQAPGMLRA